MNATAPATDYSAWLGRTEEVHDHLGPTQIQRISATFDEPVPAPGDALPALWQWCFFQPAIGEPLLGRDGHPARGGFLPPAGDRNRMWAGGRVEFIAPLRVGSSARRLSTVIHIEEKQGRSGALLFVTVRHEYFQEDRLCLREEQDIVYRDPTPPKLGSGAAPTPGDWTEEVRPTPTLLFRYSAVTFNGHRIHYDYPYVTEVEGYPGLVVHGPLIATLILRAFCRAHPAKKLRHFTYRGVRPLNVPTPFQVGGELTGPGQARLWAGNQAGVAQSAEISFD
jgi:itaconyl-CoA hydratase/mesaconyl-C4 CoA hydratase